MTNQNRNLAQKLKERFAQKQTLQLRLPAVMGDGSGNLEVIGSPGFIYVRIDERIMPVYNNLVPNQAGTEIWVGKLHEKDGFMQVLSTRTNSPTGDNHAYQGYAPARRYEFHAPNGGQDPLYIHQRALTFLRLSVSDAFATTELFVNVYRGRVWSGSQWIAVARQDVDLSAYVPATANKALFVLITINTTGAVITTPGSEVDIDALALTDIPTVPSGTAFVCGAVRVYNGQIAVQEGRTNTDIVDLRFIMNSALLPSGANKILFKDASDVAAVSDGLQYNDSLKELQLGLPSFLSAAYAFYMTSEGASFQQIMASFADSATIAPFITFLRGRGTKDAKTALLDGDVIGRIRSRGAYDNEAVTDTRMELRFKTGGDWSVTSTPTRLELWATPVGSVTMELVATITADGINLETGKEYLINGSPIGGGGAWGGITGTLSDQTDLQSALDAKLDANAPITGATKTKITYDANGLVTAGADATTSDIAEGSNLYFTAARAIAAALTGFSASAGTVSATDTILQAFNKVVGNIALKLTANAPITGATKTKITYDANGLVTAGADLAASDLPSGIDAAKIGAGVVSNTEFGYLDGVTSAIQTQIDGKQPTDTELTAFAALVSAADKVPYFTGSGTMSTADFTSLARTLLALSNPSAIRFYKINADNTISLRTAAEMLSDIGAQAAGTYLVASNNLSDLVSAATARTNLGATTVGGNLFTGTNPGAVTFIRINADNTITFRSAANMRTDLGLVIGTDVQAYDAELAALAALVSAADKLPYFTGAGTAAVTTLTSFMRTVLDDTDAATARATLGTNDAANIGAGTVSNTEFGYLDGVTSAIQTQIDNSNLFAKQRSWAL